jgi:hypothetical protein
MKKSITLITSIIFVLTLNAQTPQSFRYQAVARDNLGNILSNQPVSFRISILSGSISGSVSYSETHIGLATNAFGLVELEIGKGTPVTDTFSSVIWGSNSYFVKIEMDPAGGTSYQTLSTSQLLSVPYALHAKTVEEIPDNSVTTAKITDGAVTGAKIAQAGATSGQVLKWNGTTWAPAADLTISGSSVALGFGTTASGEYSTAMGYYTTASGDYSTSIGMFNTASGLGSTTIGSATTASGNGSIAMNYYTIAPSFCETVIGTFNNEYTPASVFTWSASDRLFVIGNGTSPSARNNALTVLKNGNVGIGTTSPNKSLTVAGDMEIGTSHGNYRHLRIGGGNSSGFLYGAFAGLGDGFNIGYNYYHNNTTDIIPNSAGGTSRIRMGYGRIEVLTNSSVARPTAGVTIANGATSWSSTSDMRLKTNVKTLTNVLDNLSDLRGVTFNWKEGNQDEQIGFIAQEIEKVYPQVISKNENDHLEVRYTELIPVLLQAIKELKAENDLLKQENEGVNARLERLEKIFEISEKFYK